MDSGELARISVLLAAVVTSITFILQDVWKAYKRKAHWVPSHYLVLSALIIQLLHLLTDKTALSKNTLSKSGNVQKHDLWMIHSSSIEFWGKLTALGIRVMVCLK
ncbi:hypothetical protein SUGI_0873540 [Cryptomeria japonica]|nr:hypothetical protein SUGI_0873480 [Cryptomeria japonica]GLJ42191.1 hypothetical protein SUGI_0873540 [Cryptomeria japonica]